MESINTGVEFYSNVKASEVEWVWYPYIPCGKITMLQGDPGEGKSTLIIHIAATLTKGGYLPDGQKIKKPEMVISVFRRWKGRYDKTKTGTGWS